MDIIIQDDGIISPFNIQSSMETRFTLMPETRDTTEEKEAADGDIDFGTELRTNFFILHGIIEFSTVDERNLIESTLKAQLNECRSPQRIMYECAPGRYTLVRLTGKPEITRYVYHIEVRAEFKADPFWSSIEEHSITGSGILINAGTFETPLVIEITGPVTNPSVVIGDQTLTYTGTVPSGQTLVIDTGNQTVKLNGVNALDKYNDIFPMLQPGNIDVTAASGGTTVFKWRDRWL